MESGTAMKTRNRGVLIAWVLLAALLAALPIQSAAAISWEYADEYAAAADGQADGSAGTAEALPPLPATLKRSNDHRKYMDGYEDGTFRPNAPLTRAELAQMLYAIIEERPERLASFPDVPENACTARRRGR